MLKNEIQIFYHALMFYSRIPTPAKVQFSEENMTKSLRYFPLVGIIVSLIGAIFFIGIRYILPVPLAIVGAITSIILVTGAFHEDGFADFFDGFGGGTSKEKILVIMKDSRSGVYGVVSIVLLLLTKFLLLSAMDISQIPLVLVMAHALSRVTPIWLTATSQYARSDGSSKSQSIGHKPSKATFFTGVVIGLLPLAFIHNYLFVPFLLLGMFVIFACYRHYIHKKLGGYTGDVLGALQQFSEIGFYIIYLVACKFI